MLSFSQTAYRFTILQGFHKSFTFSWSLKSITVAFSFLLHHENACQLYSQTFLFNVTSFHICTCWSGIFEGDELQHTNLIVYHSWTQEFCTSSNTNHFGHW